MSFRPFGFSFELRTPLDLTEVRRRVRDCKRSIVDPSDGPRGLVLGRLVWLWNSAWYSQGPMLVGWMSHDRQGCRLSGRSGSDLNGMLGITAAALFMPVVAFLDYRDGGSSPWLYVIVALTVLAAIILLVAGSNDRREGLPLVTFLETAIGTGGRHEFH